MQFSSFAIKQTHLLMASQRNNDTHNNRPIDYAFEKVRQWMTAEEVEFFSVKENHLGILLSLILQRHKAIRKHIKSLAQIADVEWEERLLRIDESIQVYHFFYQSLLCQFSDDHRKYVQVLNMLMEKLKK